MSHVCHVEVSARPGRSGSWDGRLAALWPTSGCPG